MKVIEGSDDSLLVDISDALSERDRVRFTVHTKTKLAKFPKPIMSVVRQHEDFIWLHDCLEDNDQYAGYIIPPPPQRPDFDASREKLQRLGDGESSMTKEEFAKMKQELEAEYLAIFKKTVAMHEMFLQRLAAHEKFREDNNFKIFLEYENELAVRSKSKKERLAGSIQNIGKSLTDFVITTSQVVATTSASTSILTGHATVKRQQSSNQFDHSTSSSTSGSSYQPNLAEADNGNNSVVSREPPRISNNQQLEINSNDITSSNNNNNETNNNLGDPGHEFIDEQYFEKERLFLALYHDSIRETAIQADKVTQAQKCVADSYLNIGQQLIKLASIEIVPITSETRDASSFVACSLPSLTLPTPSIPPISPSSSSFFNDNETQQRDKSSLGDVERKLIGGCSNDHTGEGLKQLLLNVSDYLEQARKLETRIASDEDLKLTDTFLYYKRDSVAAQDLLIRRLRFMAEYETATKNLEKARQKGRTQMQYADVIQKQAKENFISISKLAKQELIDYKQRRVASFKKAFSSLVELELKHLKSHSQLITNCLNTCRGLST